MERFFKDGKLYLFNQEEGNINLKAFESSIFFLTATLVFFRAILREHSTMLLSQSVKAWLRLAFAFRFLG